jgi:pimeloyl-ACP methyl ester carboxylesterase
MTEAAADALAFASDLGWDRFSLAGHSMGGQVAHQVLLQAPGRVRGLAGIDPVPTAVVPFDERARALFSGAAGLPTTGRRSPASPPAASRRGPSSTTWCSTGLRTRR